MKWSSIKEEETTKRTILGSLKAEGGHGTFLIPGQGEKALIKGKSGENVGARREANHKGL